MGEVADAYAGCRARIVELVDGLDAAGAAAVVPTCPKWSVHDVLAHLSGVVDDALAGRLDGVATDPWTAAQVEARQGLPVAGIVAEWQANAPGFEGILDAIGDPGRQAVLDTTTHEHDIRAALGRPGARDSDAVRIGLGWLTTRFVDAAAEQGIAVGVKVADGPRVGPDDAAASLTAAPFELMRALTGRRSLDQVRALDWDGDCESVLGAFTYGPFHPAQQAIVE